ncbi:MAG: Rpn family recombination-promoting nuclease/putative transposase [Legionella sp.]|nr:Rpn family recombination-promoting nuclease/putative transposase [Legionella sp.]
MTIKADDKETEDKSSVDKPHDKLVKRLLSNIATARDVLEVYLPFEVKSLIDLNFLERQPDSFVDAQHRVREVDVLFKTRCIGKEGDCYIWFLIEQQRDPDVWLPLRLFCYMGLIWDHIRKSSKSRAKSVQLPFIYPIIISNAAKPYKHSLTLRDLIEPEACRPLFDNLFKTPASLVDLAAIPDEELREKLQNHVQAQALLLSLKHVFDSNLQDYLEKVLLSTFQALEQQGYSDEVADLLYYIYNEGNLSDSSQFWAFLHQKFSKDIEEKVMTLGQQAIQQARLQESQETALRMLKEKLDIQLISKVTKLTQEEINRLANKKH